MPSASSDGSIAIKPAGPFPAAMWNVAGAVLRGTCDTGQPEVVVAHFRLANLVEFKRWIKGFGADAEVIKPESLRHELHLELRTALSRYGGDHPSG